jgi:UPF0755 protein
MPDPTHEDPFAELFGKLPDPRTRELGVPETKAPSQHPSPANPPSDEPAASTDSGPLSRREAREAAARAAGTTGSVPTPPATTPAAPADPVSAAPVAARTTPSEPAAAASDPAWSPFDDLGGEPAPGPLRSSATAAAATGGAAASRSATAVASPDISELFAGARSTDDLGSVPPPPDKRKRRIGGWIALGIVLLLVGGMAAGGVYVWTTYEDKIREFLGWEEPKDYEAGMATGEALVTISTGDVPSVISQTLYDAGVTKTPEAFYEMLIDTGRNPTFYPGVYALQQKMTSEAALAALEDPANKMENSALLREGLTVEQSLPILAESLGIPLEDFQAAIADPTVYGVPVDQAVVAAGGQPLEGWLFPAMYTFDPGVTAQEVIARLVNETIARLDEAGVPEADRQEILTTASIIQREARYEADMKKVSRVIQNRLDPANQETFGLLQMDSTAQYGYGEMHDGTASTSAEAQFDDNPWNTYVVTGLPVGPIANPGATAIAAAMAPADGDWLYFVTVNLDTGETVFTSNLADHNRAVAQWQAWCVDNPDSGC